MKSENMLRYSILDPTGNITAIVESPVEIARQPELASRIMRLRPEVEQVGFLSVPDDEGLPALRMAGGRVLRQRLHECGRACSDPAGAFARGAASARLRRGKARCGASAAQRLGKL